MREALLIFLLAAGVVIGAEIPMCDQPLPEANASIQLPAEWTSATESDEGVFVFHFGKPAKPGEPDPTAITLSVTTKVPARTSQPPSEYASALIDMSQDEGPNTPVQKGQFNGLPSLRSEYLFEGDTGKMRAINIAIPNDKTGTLYFFAWQAPLNEPAETEALREKIVASAKFDPSF